MSAMWPPFPPPLSAHLPTHPSNLPTKSNRYQPSIAPLRSLQTEVDQIDRDELKWHDALHEMRSYGYSWLVPLGRQNTQEEDAESSFSSHADSPPPDDDQMDHQDGAIDAQPIEDRGAGGGGVDLDAEIEDREGSGYSEDGDNAEEDEGEIEMQSAEESVGESEGSTARTGSTPAREGGE